MHAKPDLRVVLKWKITGSGSVIHIATITSSANLLAAYLLKREERFMAALVRFWQVR